MAQVVIIVPLGGARRRDRLFEALGVTREIATRADG
jgi:hypothetical protein